MSSKCLKVSKNKIKSMGDLEIKERIEEAIAEITNGSEIRFVAQKYLVCERTLRRMLKIWRDHQKISFDDLNHPEDNEDVYFKGEWIENLESRVDRNNDEKSLSPTSTNDMLDNFSDFKNCEQKCRLCFNSFLTLETKTKVTQSVQNKINFVFQIQLTSNDLCSKFICSKCINDLNYFFDLSRNIKEKQRNFESFCGLKNQKENYILQPMPIADVDINLQEIQSEESLLIFSKNFIESNSRSVPDVETVKISKFSSVPEEKIVENNFHDYNDSETPTVSESFTILNKSFHENDKQIKDSKPKEKSDALCDVCGIKFHFEKSMKTHQRRVHLKMRPHQCDICGRHFFVKNLIAKHMLTHVSKTIRYKGDCDICMNLRGDRNIVRRLQRVSHPNEGYLINCGKLCNHHQRNKRKCKICGNFFHNKDSLKAHMIIKHNEKSLGDFRCDECPRHFFIRSYLNRHKKVHLLEKNIDCEFPGCEKKFKTMRNMKSHKKIHLPEQQLQCPYRNCNKSYSTFLHVKRHISVFHDKVCDLCPVGNGCKYSVGRKAYMKNHLMTKHAELSPEDLENYVKMLPSMNLVH
ncbi:CLUMA_CG000608, isoform A [Clunio marinus]|uniref:CLUMA_CG000608, isoform A n=1 Tax=Clunio marinus TaxID=568069 RepID=A0A1J1HFK5_9DIPT|nr:CLUMA_CG000608, isoform A [Clunio marinus]